jgi:hypothetical protein
MQTGTKSEPSIGDMIAECLRPARTEAAMSERTILDELIERRRELWRARDEVEAQTHEIQVEIEKLAGGNADSAEWHRLAAISLRTRTPEAAQAADRQWLLMMARSHLARGTRPDMGSHRQNEIDELCDLLSRGEGH